VFAAEFCVNNKLVFAVEFYVSSEPIFVAELCGSNKIVFVVEFCATSEPAFLVDVQQQTSIT
jgi:hypothetical protein